MDSLKAQISKVRASVTGCSNDEIAIVLQHHDNDVEKTISDFLDGSAKNILCEWTHTGPVKPSKSKKKKAQQKKKQAAETKEQAKNAAKREQSVTMNGVSDGASNKESISSDKLPLEEKLPINTVNNPEDNAVINLKRMLTNEVKPPSTILPEADRNVPPEPPQLPNGDDQSKSNNKDDTPVITQAELEKTLKSHLHHSGRRSRTTSESSAKAKANRKKHKPPSNLALTDSHTTNGQSNQVPSHLSVTALSNKKSIEKASRDLQRCAVSFGRYRSLLDDEVNDSYKRIKQAFEEATNALIDREVKLIREMDKMKREAFGLLSKRETRAAELKKQTERVGSMNPQQLNDLRNEIKHFVAERKYDEEIGRTTRFVYDKEFLTKITEFGEISDVKNSYSSKPLRERYESFRSTASDVSSFSIPPAAEAPVPNDAVVPTPTEDLKPLEKNPVPDHREDLPKVESPDWAESVDTHPMLENRASWASDTPFVSSNHPRATQKGQGEKSQDHKPPRQRYNNRYNRSRDNKPSAVVPQSSSDKDVAAMPPPQRIPPQRSNRAPRGNKEGYSPRPQRDDRDTKNKASGGNQSNASNSESSGGFGDGYRGSPKPKYRGGSRGGYRNNPRGGFRNGPNDRSGKTHQVNGEALDSRPRDQEHSGSPLPQRNRPRNQQREPRSQQNNQKSFNKPKSDSNTDSNRPVNNHVNNTEKKLPKQDVKAPQKQPDKTA